MFSYDNHLLAMQLGSPWLLLAVPLLIVLFYKACHRKHAIPISVWSFLCPIILDAPPSGARNAKLQKRRFALLCAGLLAALAIVLEPNWPSKLWVLCLQGRSLKNAGALDVKVWQSTFEQNLAQKFGMSASSERAVGMAFIHPDGRVFESLQDLSAELSLEDFSKTELPRSFLEYSGPKVIMSNWRLEAWGEIPNMNYGMLSRGRLNTDHINKNIPDIDINKNIPDININKNISVMPKNLPSISVSTQPLDSSMLVALAPKSGFASLKHADKNWPISTSQALGLEALVLPWHSTSVEFKTAQGEIVDILDLSPPPSHQLAYVTHQNLAPELASALKKYKTDRQQKLILTSYTRMHELPKDSAAWIFWDDYPHATEELPSGLPLLLQTSTLCPQSILHAALDWPVDRLPRRAFVDVKDLLVGTQGLPLVRWYNRQENQMAWNLPANTHMSEHFWTLLLQTTFPQISQVWTREETKSPMDLDPNRRQGFSPTTKLMLAICMTLLWYWAWILGRST